MTDPNGDGEWEIEPLRWLAVNAVYTAYRAADRAEHRRADLLIGDDCPCWRQ